MVIVDCRDEKKKREKKAGPIPLMRPTHESTRGQNLTTKRKKIEEREVKNEAKHLSKRKRQKS